MVLPIEQDARGEREGASEFDGDGDSDSPAGSIENLSDDVGRYGRRLGELGLVPPTGVHFRAQAITHVRALGGGAGGDRVVRGAVRA